MRRVGLSAVAVVACAALLAACSGRPSTVVTLSTASTPTCHPSPAPRASRPVSSQPSVSELPPIGFTPCFTVAAAGLVNRTPHAGVGTYTIPSGTRLTLTVTVVVPARSVIRQLWLAIGHGHDGFGYGRPIHEHPVLLHATGALPTGRDEFTLDWNVPAHVHAPTSLTASWGSSTGVEQTQIAFFNSAP
jgi:hypothetical protein